VSTVADRLAARIARDGPLPFADVMEEALYGEGGYYARDELAIGPYGDFVTGSSVSPLFGRATARVASRLAIQLAERQDYLEIGYGGGEHLAAVAEGLGITAGGRIRAWDRVPRATPPGVTRLDSLDALEAGEVHGLVFSYELFDALPVHRLIGRGGGSVGELLVDWRPDSGFRYLEADLSTPALAELLGGQALERGQVADLAPGWRPLYRRLARALGRGMIVTFDYGYERARLLDPRIRRDGTLACYRRQRVHRDALRRLGEEDLTAHVDWTAIREAGEAEGLETVALTRQARWLVAAGIFDDIGDSRTVVQSAARTLLDGEGMGEEIRVLVQARGLDVASVLDLAVLGGAHADAPTAPASP
jgi:SAM-dependent MidA family methyltransferase